MSEDGEARIIELLEEIAASLTIIERDTEKIKENTGIVASCVDSVAERRSSTMFVTRRYLRTDRYARKKIGDGKR